MSRRCSMRWPLGLALLSLSVLAVVVGPVDAETAAPRTDARLTVLADSSAPDPTDDGMIRTHDVAAWRLDVSQNGADALEPVVALIELSHATFVDADASTEVMDPPPVCGAGSWVDADRRTLACDLGLLPQGTSVALDYAVRADGDVDHGTTLAGTVRIPGGAPLAMAPLTIVGTDQVDVGIAHVGHAPGVHEGIAGYFVRYRIDVRTDGAEGRGGLPLDSVRFVVDWSDVASTFPGAQLAASDPTNPSGQVQPIGLNATAVARAVPSAEPGATHNTPDWIIADPGTWAPAYDDQADTTVAVTVSGFSNESTPNRSLQTSAVTSGLLTAFVPTSAVPFGVTGFAVSVAEVVGVPRGGDAVADLDPANDRAEASLFRVMGAGYRSQQSAWVDPGFGIGDRDGAALWGSFSSYLRPALDSNGLSSGGHQVAYPGMAVTAEAVSDVQPSRVVGSVTSTLACTKLDRPLAGRADAVADVVALSASAAPPVVEVPHGPITIEYATLADPSASTTCADGDGAWAATRPATFNAVRAFVDVRDGVAPASADGRSLALVLQVPVAVPADAAVGSTMGFWNTAVMGDLAPGGPVGATTLATDPVDGAWLGTTTDAYDVVANSGDARGGDRLVIGRAVSRLDKRVCDGDGGTVEAALGDRLRFCLDASIEGSGVVRDLRIADESLARSGSPMTYVGGSATVRVGDGAPTPLEPVEDADGRLVWSIGEVQAPNQVTVELEATSATRSARPGDSWQNLARLESPDLPHLGHLATWVDPNADAQAVRFRSGRFQLHVAKSTSSPAVDHPDRPVVWEVSLVNQGEVPIGRTDVIDVLPHDGDGALSRVPPSRFHGTVGLTGAASGPGRVRYATAAPTTISSDPADPSNGPGGATAWVDEPSDWSSVTAVRFESAAPLLPGESMVLTVPMATAGNQADDVYTNDAEASVVEGEDGPTLPIRSNDVTVTVAEPGLVITKATELDPATSEPRLLQAGDEVTYAIAVANDGGIEEPAAVVRDVLRPGMAFVAADGGATYDEASRTVTWPPVAVAPGATVARSLTVAIEAPLHPDLVDADRQVPNTASVSGQQACTQTDPPCDATVRNPLGQPALTQDKVVDRDEATPGDRLEYHLAVGNEGSAPATGVVAIDHLPDGVVLVDARADAGVITADDEGALVWTIGDLAPGVEVEATVVAEIEPGRFAATLENRFVASHAPGDCAGPCGPTEVAHPCDDDPSWSCALTRTPSEATPPPPAGEPTSPAPAAPAPPSSPAPSPAPPTWRGALPRTGAGLIGVSALAVLLLATGTATVPWRRTPGRGRGCDGHDRREGCR